MSKEHEGVWIFSEIPQLAFELLGKGRVLADQLGAQLVAVAIGSGQDPQAYVQHGADKVLVLNNEALNVFNVDTWTDAFATVAAEQKPEVILIGATRCGLEFAPRLCERLKTGCVTEATRLELDAEKKFLMMDRVTLGGNLVETQICKSAPQVATVPKGVFSPLLTDPNRKGEVVKIEAVVKPATTKLLESRPKTATGVKLADASIIVSFGRGVKKKEDVRMLEQFAQIVRGVIGCSRPIAEDLGWLPEDQYVGLSGQKVSPKLYLAFGISGQIQHLTGIRNSRIIAAVNNDPKAPIFEFSDYGVVGDLYQIIPALNDAVKQLGKA
jgi:electron transfer flavoprotein alpha subunit